MDVDGMSLSELRELITTAGLVFSDCLENSEFRDRARYAIYKQHHEKMMQDMSNKRLRAMVDASGAGLNGCIEKGEVIARLQEITNSPSGHAQRFAKWEEHELRKFIESNDLSHDGLASTDQLVQIAVFAELRSVSIEIEIEKKIKAKEQEQQAREQQAKEQQARAAHDARQRTFFQTPAPPKPPPKAPPKAPRPGTKADLQAKLNAALSEIAQLEARTAGAATLATAAGNSGSAGTSAAVADTIAADAIAVSNAAHLAEERRARQRAEERVRQMECERDMRHAADECEATATTLGFRQYVEMLLKQAGAVAKSGQWKLRLCRQRVVTDVVEYFKKLSSPSQIWRRTLVTFVDEHGTLEPGLDEGGLTATAHALFWRGVLAKEVGLFECCEGGTCYLPRAAADEVTLELVGRVLLKSVLDNHPIGAGLSSFVFEFLADSHDRRVFMPQQPLAALSALDEYDSELSRQYRQLLDADDNHLACLGVTRSYFDEQFGDEPLTRSNVAETVVAGCRRLLFLDRRSSLEALKRGFTFKNIDLTIQLAAMPSAVTKLLVRGRVSLRANDLLASVDWDVASTGLEKRVAAMMREYIETAMDEPNRLRFLRWCTGLNALPADGLKQPVTLLSLVGIASAPDDCLPRAHTCSYEIELPAYSSLAVLREKLNRAMDEMDAGGTFELE